MCLSVDDEVVQVELVAKEVKVEVVVQIVMVIVEG